MKTLRKLFHDWLSGPTNEHYEAGRFLWFVSVLAAIGYAGAHLYVNGVFDILEFGGGIAALLAAGGFGIGVKDRAARDARE